jgi:hypothetical protein
VSLGGKVANLSGKETPYSLILDLAASDESVKYDRLPVMRLLDCAEECCAQF